MNRNHIHGFTLMTLSILLFPRIQDSAQIIQSAKAAELGAAIMDEITGRSYDENSGPNGGLPECNHPRSLPCTDPKKLGSSRLSGESRDEPFFIYKQISC
ncbi:hypothetical protein [Aliivibrio logei]|uniref:hypothetical protein n=1 Tax=Aliivibrio logei TaxID=688 RepID=UPI0035C8EF96